MKSKSIAAPGLGAVAGAHLRAIPFSRHQADVTIAIFWRLSTRDSAAVRLEALHFRTEYTMGVGARMSTPALYVCAFVRSVLRNSTIASVSRSQYLMRAVRRRAFSAGSPSPKAIRWNWSDAMVPSWISRSS